MKDSIAVIGRMSFVLGVKNDTDLAKSLGIPRNTISTWKNRNSIPYAHCISLSERKNVSLDWLLANRGEMMLESVDQVYQGIVDMIDSIEDLVENISVSEHEQIVEFDREGIDYIKSEICNLRNAALCASAEIDAPDIDTIQLIIEEMETYLNNEARTMPPERKAMQVTKFYCHFEQMGEKPTREDVRNIVMLIA